MECNEGGGGAAAEHKHALGRFAAAAPVPSDETRADREGPPLPPPPGAGWWNERHAKWMAGEGGGGDGMLLAGILAWADELWGSFVSAANGAQNGRRALIKYSHGIKFLDFKHPIESIEPTVT